MQTLKEKAKLDAESNTLGVWCLQAEAEVMELKEKVSILERRGGYRVSPTTTSATLAPYSHPVLGGLGGELTAQASPQLGERNEWAGSAAGAYTPFPGARSLGILSTIRHWIA